MPDNNMLQTIGMASNPNFDPAEYARQQQALAMGQALLQGSMQAPEGQMVSGHYVAPSWTQQLARVLSGYAGNKAATDANAYMLKTNIGNTQAMLNSLPSGQAQGQPMPAAGTPPGGAATVAPFSPAGYPQAAASSQGAASSAPGYSPMAGAGQAGNNPFTRENVIQSMILNGFSPEAAKAFWARTAPAPTTEQLNWQAQGIDPHQLAPYTVQAAAKAGLIEKNGVYIDPRSMTPVGFVPEIAPGTMPVYNQGATAPKGFQTIEGQPITYPQALQANANATAAGSGNVDMVQVFNPQTQQMELVPKTIAATAAGGGAPGSSFLNAIMQTESGGNPNALSPKGAQGLMQVMPNTKTNPGFGVTPAKDNSPQELQRVGNDYLAALQQRYKNPTLTAIAYNMGPGATDKWLAGGGDVNKLPAETRNYVASVMTRDAVGSRQPQPMAAGPRLGDTAGATAQATDSQAAWGKLQEATRQAQTTTSYLQNINDLAQKAIVGPASSKLNFANGLLSLLPGTERANNAQTATDLLNKYSSQITARLGAGGMGTDAARTILQAAYPGTHMTADAIHEAVGNLVGANEMIKAKATLLAPYGNNRDYVGYQKAEMAFDKNADPRIWQYKALRETNPQAAQVFLKNTLKQDPHFIDKADVLSKMGAL